MKNKTSIKFFNYLPVTESARIQATTQGTEKQREIDQLSLLTFKHEFINMFQSKDV
jgi:hypothetical protein